MAFAADVESDAEIEVVWVTAALLPEEAVSFFASQPDKSYSLCDAVSYLLMRGAALVRRRPRTTISQAGFQRLLSG